MANNGGRIITGPLAHNSDPRRSSPPLAAEAESAGTSSAVFVFLPGATMERELRARLRAVRDKIDSPKTLFILKNALLTELELYGAESGSSLKRGCKTQYSGSGAIFVECLLSDAQFREKVVDMLISTTPDVWDQNWNSVWNKDADPLYSERQQTILRRRSLITFWTNEWKTIPDEQVESAINVARALPRK
jgi:hypothetical protein